MSGELSPFNPNALTVEQMARLLSAAGKRLISAETIRQDVDAGAPLNANGTINLVNYAAWLAKEENNET